MRLLPLRLSLLVALLASAPAIPAGLHAQENPVAPGTATPPEGATRPETGPARVERSIYLPYEDLEKIFEQEGRGVFLPYREFLDLWNQLNLKPDAAAEKPPADGVLASATYSARVEGDEHQVLAIDAVLRAESFKEKGWAVVPLIGAGLNVAEADTGEATLHLGANGYELILPKKGPYEIRLKLYARIERSSGRHAVTLNLPRAGVSKFEAVLPEQGWDFDIRPGAAYSSEALPDGATRLAFFFGETERFDLSWQKQGEETKLTPLLFVESALASTVVPGALQTEARLDYRILRAGIDTFTVTVPAGHEILSVGGENIKEWDVKPGGPGGAQRLTVRLHAPAKSAHTLTISLEQALDALPTEFDIPEVLAEGVVRQRGEIVLNAGDELEVESVAQSGLAQQS
ncbi:MAG: hypothetical protein KDM91_07410, partial [Verrucomicrobiae bacterium]|nr:hypothetical protein [Verrucomicrobiae bacterium]